VEILVWDQHQNPRIVEWQSFTPGGQHGLDLVLVLYDVVKEQNQELELVIREMLVESRVLDHPLRWQYVEHQLFTRDGQHGVRTVFVPHHVVLEHK